MTTGAFYVVTRDGRRIEERNYTNASEAKARSDALKAVLSEWDPSSLRSVSIVKTDKPNRIR